MNARQRTLNVLEHYIGSPALGLRYLAMNGITNYTVERNHSRSWSVFAETSDRCGFIEATVGRKRDAMAIANRLNAIRKEMTSCA